MFGRCSPRRRAISSHKETAIAIAGCHWDDPRRAVFHTGIVIVEIDNAMRRAAKRAPR